MRLAFLRSSGTTLALWLGAAAPALACSLAPTGFGPVGAPNTAGEVSAELPVPEIVGTRIVRGTGPVCDGDSCSFSSCDDLGFIDLELARTGGGDIGYEVVLVEGSPPAGVSLPQALRPIGNSLSLSWIDGATDDQESIDFTVTVNAVTLDGDRGAPSAPVRLRDGVDAVAPPSPGGLRAELYSATAAELFWTRPSSEAGIAGYEVVRDGSVLAVVGGTSWFAEGLEPGRRYRYAVTTIDAQGARSAPAEIDLSTDDRPLPPVVIPPEPANLRAEVYSSTAAELFWDRSDVPGIVYEIVRDGDPAGTTDGTSWFTNALEPDTNYRFSVTATTRPARPTVGGVTIVSTGSAPSVVTLDTPPR